jgi:hypothetical protein
MQIVTTMAMLRRVKYIAIQHYISGVSAETEAKYLRWADYCKKTTEQTHPAISVAMNTRAV